MTARFDLDVFDGGAIVDEERLVVHAVVSVRCSGVAAPAPAADVAEIVVIDVSSSMGSPPDKIIAARAAAARAVEALPDGVHFAVLCGHTVAEMVHPAHPGMAVMTPSARDDALRAIRGLACAGGSALDRWLVRAAELFDTVEAGRRHLLVLTDGDALDGDGALDAALEDCAGRFRCDLRGVGDDWDPEVLQRVADHLDGTAAPLAAGEGLGADVDSLMGGALRPSSDEVDLVLRPTAGVEVVLARQVVPGGIDLVPAPPDGALVRYPLGRWGSESRDIHVAVAVPAGADGGEPPARVELVSEGRLLAAGAVGGRRPPACPDCAAEVDEEALFCAGCGRDLTTGQRPAG